MKNTKRAIRKSHYSRLKKNVADKQYYGRTCLEWSENAAQLGSAVNTPKKPKCWCCCNVRSNLWLKAKERLTLQERRSNDSFDEWMSE